MFYIVLKGNLRMKNMPDTAVVIIIYLFIFLRDLISVLQLFPFL